MRTETAIKFKDADMETVPKGWKILPLIEVVNFNPKRELKKGQQTKFVAMTDVQPFTKKALTYSIRDFSGGSKFKNGDTLMARITPCLENGKTIFVDFLETNETAGGSTEFIVLCEKDQVSNSNFIYYLITSPAIREASIKAMTGTSGRQRVESSKLVNQLVKLPPLTEQEKIAEILSSLDDKIELSRKTNKNLEEIASTIFKKWFIDIEDELPEGWRIGSLGEVIENFDSKRVPLSSRQRNHGPYPYYGATSIMDYVEGYIFDGIYTLVGEDGSVIRENNRPFTQYVSGKIWVNNHAHVLQGKNGFSTEYIKVLLDQVDIAPFVTGAVQPKLSQSNMNRIPIIIPDEITLKRFNRVLLDIFNIIISNEEQVKNLEAIRDSLLPQLMAGKIRTKI